jgi:exodeoxyribonuclease VII large subunit
MNQLPLFQPASWTVTDLTHYLRELIEGDSNLQDLWVQGEVSNVSRPSSGHLYFTLKDAGAALRCVMWRNTVSRQTFVPQEGDAIEAHGSIGIYEVSGQYQLYTDWIRPAGEGVLYQEFLRLKARLEAEGLFDESRKRPIPRWPHRIGLVTSPTGAALRDILNTLRRRYPLVQVILSPTPVQGVDAPPGIVAALQALNELAQPDVILLARGGGAIEDLWAFNDERVARAIVSSKAPVISGVGHETDFTIADFAADLRAPTPTAAAELATPNQDDLRALLSEDLTHMRRSMESLLSGYRWELDVQRNRLWLYSPVPQIRSDRQRLDDLTRRAGAALTHRIKLQRTRFSGLDQRLSALNPLAVLERGYSIITQLDGQVVRRVHQVKPGEDLDVRVSDGEFGVQVKEESSLRE